jgi:hypothetical protein
LTPCRDASPMIFNFPRCCATPSGGGSGDGGGCDCWYSIQSMLSNVRGTFLVGPTMMHACELHTGATGRSHPPPGWTQMNGILAGVTGGTRAAIHVCRSLLFGRGIAVGGVLVRDWMDCGAGGPLPPPPPARARCSSGAAILFNCRQHQGGVAVAALMARASTDGLGVAARAAHCLPLTLVVPWRSDHSVAAVADEAALMAHASTGWVCVVARAAPHPLPPPALVVPLVAP